jgi:hypothetical protein
MAKRKRVGGRHECRRAYCHNLYDEVIGGAGWGGDGSGAECVPCMYAVQMVGQAPAPTWSRPCPS